MRATGRALACKETAKPVMMLVAWPITAKETKQPKTASGSAKRIRITMGTTSKQTRITTIR